MITSTFEQLKLIIKLSNKKRVIRNNEIYSIFGRFTALLSEINSIICITILVKGTSVRLALRTLWFGIYRRTRNFEKLGAIH
jgi:hypothetical protein